PQTGDVLPEQSDLAGVGQNVAGDLVEQGRLPCAVRAKQQPALAGTDRDGHVLRSRQTTELLVQMDHLERVSRIRRPHLRGSLTKETRRFTPGTMPSGMTRTMIRNMKPSSIFHLSR